MKSSPSCTPYSTACLIEPTMHPKKRVHYIPAHKFLNLSNCCQMLLKAYGSVVYLVGSASQRPDFRDVDLVMIVKDDEFDALFPGEGVPSNHNMSMLWCITCTSIGLWLSQQAGLAVDFKIQRMTQANLEHAKPRHPMGLGYGPNPADYAHTNAVSLDTSGPSSSNEPAPDSSSPCLEK